MTNTVRDKFLHIADLHFWRLTLNPMRQLNKRVLGNLNLFLKRRHEFVMENAEPYLDHVKSVGIPDAVFTGDFTTTSLPEEFEMSQAFMRRATDAGLRAVAVPGNHDLYTFAAERRNVFLEHLREWAGDDSLPTLYRLPGGTPVLLVPTVCANWVSSKGVIREAEIARTRSLLDGIDDQVIVAGHYPLLTETAAYTLTPGRQMRGAEELRRALGESGKSILYICGHVHRFSYTADPQYANLQHLTTGTLFGRNHAQHRDGEFSEIHTDGAGWAVFNHVHDGGWRREEVSCT
jgi:hypothetical protein